MGTGHQRLRLAAFAVLAAGQLAAWAGPRETSPVYWGGARTAEPVDQAAFIGAERRRGRMSEDDVGARQIHAAARVAPRAGAFAAWHCRRALRIEARRPFCNRFSGAGDPLFSKPGGDQGPFVVEILPVSAEVRPAAVPFVRRRARAISRGAASPDPLACAGPCESYAAIVQAGAGSGGNSAGILQSGPNAAVIAQQMNGSGVNITFAAQWGACNHALIVQAAAAGVTNLSIVNQAGTRNTAVVLQH